MIKQNENECSIQGNPQLVINEAASLVLNIATSIYEKTGISEEEVLAQIQQAIQLNTLITAGMSINDALEIADPKHNIVKVTATEEDGSTTVLKDIKNEQ